MSTGHAPSAVSANLTRWWSVISGEGIRHVRIRVAGEPTEARLIHLRKLVEACEQYGVIPIIAYQADEYKTTRKRIPKKR